MKSETSNKPRTEAAKLKKADKCSKEKKEPNLPCEDGHIRTDCSNQGSSTYENGAMYANTKTWNPFKGCGYDCTYCEPTFKRQAKRQKHLCDKCYKYEPHVHRDRLDKIPSADTIFVAGNADLAFCPKDFIGEIIDKVKEHNQRSPHKTYFFQSKKPAIFKKFVQDLPENAIILTTLETNRDVGYDRVSKAPVPSERYKQFLDLNYKRKVVTIEPLMGCDPVEFAQMIADLKTEYVWLGLNSKPSSVKLPEPTYEETLLLINELQKHQVDIRFKEMRQFNNKTVEEMSQIVDGYNLNWEDAFDFSDEENE